jgi:hypothetical protein
MPTRTYRLATMSLLILIAGLRTVRVTAGDWPIFHGPQHNNISSERHWGEDWANCSLKVRWTKTVGMGSSTVVVADGRLYTMGNSQLLVGSARRDCDVSVAWMAGAAPAFSYPATRGPLYEGAPTWHRP